LVALAVSWAAPAVAGAHLNSGTLSTDFEAHVGSVRPAVQGVGARVLGGDQRLELRVAPSRVVIVLGLLGEPFLRFSRTGVEANLASPTASSARIIKTSEAVASPEPRWHRVSRGHVFAWHEGRLRPVSAVRDPSTRPSAVATWSIPLLVDGRRASLVGTEWYAAAPPLWPWLVAGTLLISLGVLAARVLPSRRRRLIAKVLLPLSVAACLASWFASLLADRVTVLMVVFAIGFAGATALLLYVAVAAARGEAQLGGMALIGGFATAFALPQVGVFGHGFVLSALPAFAARLAVATAVVGGIAVAAVCMPSVIELLAIKPRTRRVARPGTSSR
jgi:hypothetical protein